MVDLPSLALGLGVGLLLGVSASVVEGRRALRGMHRVLRRLVGRAL